MTGTLHHTENVTEPKSSQFSDTITANKGVVGTIRAGYQQHRIFPGIALIDETYLLKSG